MNLAAGLAASSALHLAVRHALTDIADVLIAGGAFVDIRAHDGTKPLTTAVLSGGAEAAVQLVRAGAQVAASQ